MPTSRNKKNHKQINLTSKGTRKEQRTKPKVSKGGKNKDLVEIKNIYSKKYKISMKSRAGSLKR